MAKVHFFLKEPGITFRFLVPLLVLCHVFYGMVDLGGYSLFECKKLLFLDFESPNSSGEDILLRKRQISISTAGGVGGSRAIRVDYLGIERGSERVVAAISLKKRANEMSLCYDVLFPEGFKFVKGGKLHGLGPSLPVTGGKPVFPSGWSARVGFRPKGGISTYIYDQEKKTRYGITRTAPKFVFKPGHYHSVSLHVKLNNPAREKNGFVHLYVDGREVVRSENVRFRSSVDKDSLIGMFLFNTFHGGSSIEYAPRTKGGKFTRESAYFDNIGIYEGKNVRPEPLAGDSSTTTTE
jgi:hypothetical protein